MKLADIGLDPTTNTFGAADVALGGKLAKLIELAQSHENTLQSLVNMDSELNMTSSSDGKKYLLGRVAAVARKALTGKEEPS